MSHWPLTVLHSIAAMTKMMIPLILVRLFPSEMIGEYKLFFLFLYFVPELLGVGGLVNGLGYWSGEREGRGLVSAASLLTLLVTVVAVPLVLIAYSLDILSFTDYHLLYAFVLYTVVSLPRLFLEELLIVSDQVWISARYHLTAELTRAICLVVAALVTENIAIALYASASITGIEVAAYCVCAYKSGIWSLTELKREHFQRVTAYAMPLAVAGLATVLFQKCDQLFTSQTLSSSEFALYTLGCLVIPPLLVLEQSVTRILIPFLSRKRAQEGKEAEQARAVRLATLQISFWTIPSACFVYVLSKPIVVVLYTEAYAGSAIYLKLFAASYIFLGFPLDVVPRAYGKSRWLFMTHIASGVLSLALVSFFGLQFGAVGALSAMILSQVAMRLYGLRYAATLLKTELIELVPVKGLIRIGIASFIGAMLVMILPYFISTPIAEVLIGMILFSAGFLLGWYGVPTTYFESRKKRKVEGTKVLHVTQYLALGGLEKMVTELAIELQKTSRWKSFVFSYDALANEHRSELQQKLMASGVEVEAVQKREGFCVRTLLHLIDFIQRNRIEVIHSHDLGGLIYASLAKLLSFESPVLVHTQHSFVHVDRYKRYKWFERIFTRFADRIVCVGENVREQYLSLGVSARKLQTISNGVRFNYDPQGRDSALVARKEALSDATLSSGQMSDLLALPNWIVYVGRIFPGKGQDEALRIWENLPDDLRKKTALLFVGPSTCEEEVAKLEKEKSRSSHSKHIFLTGPSSAPYLWYRAATICLSCSAAEGHPLVPLEALGNDCPFVASGIEGHASLAKKAVLYEAGNELAGARALGDLLLSIDDHASENRTRWQSRGEILREQFSFQWTRYDYEAVYAELLRDGASTPRRDSAVFRSRVSLGVLKEVRT